MKFKKFFIVPVVSLLLLLAYPFSSALAADEDYFLPSGSLGLDVLEDSDYLRQMAIDSVSTNATETVRSYFNSCNYQDLPNYFTMIDMSSNSYENSFIPDNSNSSFTITYLFSAESIPTYDEYDYFAYPISGCFVTFTCLYDYQLDSFTVTNTSYGFSTTKQFIFNKSNARYQYINSSSVPTWSSSGYSDFRSSPKYIFYADSNFAPLPDGINSGGSGFDISVSFNPVLHNTVNMTTFDNGVSTLSNYFNMSVRNNGSKSIQFFMAITEPGTNVFTGYQGVYNDYGENVRFVYSSDEWIDQIDEFDVTGVNNTYVSALRRSEWHRVDPLQQVNRNFAWSQMSLQKDHLYDVVVYAMPTREGSTNVSIMHELPAFDWSSCAEVYRSSFKLPVSTKYDPNDNSFGNYANSTGDTMSHSNFSAYIDDNGKVQVPGDGKYFTADDIRNRYSQGSVSSSSPGSVSSDLNSVASNFHTFFEFINRIFSYFPRGYQAVITAGLTSIIVLGIIKVVLR